MLPTSTKAQTGITIAFPDVCYSPGSNTSNAVPVPYPDIAATAARKQQQKQLQTKKPPTSYPLPAAASVRQKVFFTATPVKIRAEGTALSRHAEISVLKTGLDTLNTRLQTLPPTDPNAWQAVLQEYVVLASALYVTEKDDD